MIDAAPPIAWEIIDGRSCVVITFTGVFTAEASKAWTERVRREIEGSPTPVAMVWDAGEMTSYESEARKKWQTEINELKPKIAAIHLIARSTFVRMGGLMVGAFLGYPIQCWKQKSEIKHRP